MDPVSGKLSHSWDMSDINDINVVASGHTGEVQQPDHGVLAFSDHLAFSVDGTVQKVVVAPKNCTWYLQFHYMVYGCL